MATDAKFDFASRDFVDAADGSWVESEDSSTAVWLQMECEEGAWWGDPPSGSRNHEIMRSDLPTIEDLQDSSKRAMKMLVRSGLITDLTVAIDEDAQPVLGLAQLNLTWRDRATSHPGDLAYSPIGGHP